MDYSGVMRLNDCNGQSQCRRCKMLGKYNVDWTCFMYKIDGLDGHYCFDCVKEIKSYGGDFHG